MHLTVYLCLLLNLLVGVLTYTVPDPKIEFLSSKGKIRRMRVSIPDEDGIKSVFYSLFIPNDTNFTTQVLTNFTEHTFNATNGKWAFEVDITNILIIPGSQINFSLTVQHSGKQFIKKGSLTIPVGVHNPVHISALQKSYDKKYAELITMAKQLYVEERERPNCDLSKTIVDQNPVCKGELIFEDNFDKLNLTMWKHEVRIPLYVDDAEFVSFQKRDENCYVSDGQLHIVPTLLSDMSGFSESSIKTGKLDLEKECTGVENFAEECKREARFSQILPPVVSARLRTKESFNFRYGKVEVRAKMPKGDWLFPLISLDPTENYYGSKGYASGQMRVAFIRGNEILHDRHDNEISGYRIAGGIVLSTRETLRDVWLRGSVRRDHLGDDFHNYTLTWTDEFISLEIDGNEYATIHAGFAQLSTTRKLKHAKLWESGDIMAPFDREFFLTLGVSAGGHSDFPDGVRNGLEEQEKPWKNAHPKAELQFWNDRESWHKTWNGENAGLHVDYIRVYAL